MVALRKFWRSVKRNPVINAFIVAVLVQLLQDYRANAIDWAHFAGYFAMLCIAVAARQFTVPNDEHQQLKSQVSRIVVQRAQKPGSDHFDPDAF